MGLIRKILQKKKEVTFVRVAIDGVQRERYINVVVIFIKLCAGVPKFQPYHRLSSPHEERISELVGKTAPLAFTRVLN